MIGLLLAYAAAAPVQAAPRVPITGQAPARRLQAWLPGEVRCGGRTVKPVQWRRPFLAYGYPAPEVGQATYRFALDGSGRPISIKATAIGFLPFAEDIGPSLAASRFGVEGARADCVVTYTARFTGPADTPLADAVSYTLAPTQGQLPRDWWADIFPATSTCDDEPRPAPLLQAYPDFAAIGGTAGARHWTMFAYDLDRRGRPVRIRVLTGTGNPVLERAGAASLSRSRYTGGARTGCRFPFIRPAEIMPAPPMPDAVSTGAAEPPAPCRGDWATMPPLSYPQAYRRRGIEGWAIIGYDLAPWGATGDVKVLDAQPAAEFGERAAALVRAARRQPSATGTTGCVETVRFVMARPGMAPDTPMTDD